jgi:hypothetical protein
MSPPGKDRQRRERGQGSEEQDLIGRHGGRRERPERTGTFPMPGRVLLAVFLVMHRHRPGVGAESKRNRAGSTGPDHEAGRNEGPQQQDAKEEDQEPWPYLPVAVR